VFAYVGVILLVSARPNLKPPIEFFNADKVAHILEYAGLGVLLARALRAQLNQRYAFRAAVLALVLGMCVGAGDETFQRLIPGRDSSVFDLVADTIGLLLAQIVYLTFAKD
jgi:VanZ family protein